MRTFGRLVWWIIVTLSIFTRDGFCTMMEGVRPDVQYHMGPYIQYHTETEEKIVVRARPEGQGTSRSLRMAIGTSLQQLPTLLFGSHNSVRSFERTKYFDDILLLQGEVHEVEVVSGSTSFVSILIGAYCKEAAWEKLEKTERAKDAVMNLVNKIKDDRCELVEDVLGGKSVAEDDVSGKRRRVDSGGDSRRPKPRCLENESGAEYTIMDTVDVLQISASTHISVSESPTQCENGIDVSVGVYVTERDPTHLAMLGFRADHAFIYVQHNENQLFRSMPAWQSAVIILNNDQKTRLFLAMEEALLKVKTEDYMMGHEEEDEIIQDMRKDSGFAEEHAHNQFMARWAVFARLGGEQFVHIKIVYSDKAQTVASGTLKDVVHFVARYLVSRFKESVQTEVPLSPILFGVYLPNEGDGKQQIVYVFMKAHISY